MLPLLVGQWAWQQMKSINEIMARGRVREREATSLRLCVCVCVSGRSNQAACRLCCQCLSRYESSSCGSVFSHSPTPTPTAAPSFRKIPHIISVLIRKKRTEQVAAKRILSANQKNQGKIDNNKSRAKFDNNNIKDCKILPAI